MDKEKNKRLIDKTVRQYFRQKVKEKFPEDFWLIEVELDSLINQHDLKELIMAVAIRLQQIKTSGKQSD